MGSLSHVRDDARSTLADSYARELIDQPELERRLEAVEAASTVVAIEQMTADLQPRHGTEHAERAETTALVQPIGPKRITSVLSNVERQGRWTLGSANTVYVVLGNVELDLRTATVASSLTVLQVTVILGNLELIVPPGFVVENQCTAVLSSLEDHHGETPIEPEQRRVIRLEGKVVLGSVTVRERQPGEGTIAAWMRRRRERKQLQASSAKALPDDR